MLHVCLSLPKPVGTIKYALKCIKKTITPPLTRRASKLYYGVMKDQQKNALIVKNTVAKSINDNI